MVMFGCSRFMTTQRLCWQRRSVQNVPQSVKCASQCVPCMSSTSVLWCLSAARFMWNNSAESVVDSRSTSKSSALRDSVPLQSVYCTASGSGAAVRLALEPTRPALVRTVDSINANAQLCQAPRSCRHLVLHRWSPALPPSSRRFRMRPGKLLLKLLLLL